MPENVSYDIYNLRSNGIKFMEMMLNKLKNVPVINTYHKLR